LIIIEERSNNQEHFDNAITIDMFGNCFWRPYEFSCDDNIIVLKSEVLTKNTAHYFLSAVKKYIGIFHYNNQYRLEDLRKHIMDIPVKNGDFDFHLIENISGILSKIAELETELETELEARTKQYEYYRNKLLDFSNSPIGVHRIDKMLAEIYPDGIQFQELISISEYLSSGRNKKKTSQGEYPVYGYSVHEKCDISDNTLILKLKETVNSKFYYYYLKNSRLNQYAKGGGQPLITAGFLKSLIIPVPPIEVQNEIVQILDNFSGYVTSISQGLPAEIAARRKQYEYYRNSMLSF